MNHFRSYDAFELDSLGSLSIFVGQNAIGKTNIIEGIELMTSLSSFRHAPARHMVQWGYEKARLQTRLIGSDKRMIDITLELSDNHKTYQLNGKSVRTSSIRGTLPSVCFTPDDLELVKGSNQIKRLTLDTLGSQLSRNYHAVRKDYEKILKQKNHLLKDGTSAAFRASVDEVLTVIGANLSTRRYELASHLRPYLQTYYHAISGGSEDIDISYVPSWITWDMDSPQTYSYDIEEARDQLTQVISQGLVREEERHHALWGPHADMVAFFINGRNASQFASQGQQRSIVLAYKLAEAALIQDITGQQPVLLLDDVMSELDENRRTALVEFIEGDIQTFITTTNLDYFSPNLLNRADVIHLSSFSHSHECCISSSFVKKNG